MENKVIKVDGMSCEHCVNAVTKAVKSLPGISNVAVDLDAGTVTVGYDGEKCAIEKIKDAIADQGYDVVA